ncbi:MAG TPA: radical SAM protein, partial [Planctomycetota bacterium]|nr:radical SAM protein [Planctomycetota bacterium]
IRVIPMLASFGCPYTCSFCIDAEVPYQPLALDGLKEDLRFLRTKFKRPIVAWHDPNFGVRFDQTLAAIEEAVPPDSIAFIGESSLSILTEPHVRRLARAGFKAVLPGIESWFDLGAKSKTGKAQGAEKVKQVSAHVRMILRHIPYVQTNFVLGMDADAGPEPFELTKRFVDLTPGAFPGYSLLTAFGRAAPLNLQYQREGRVLPFPFALLNNNQAMNVRPRNYGWTDFYDRVVDVVRHSFSPRIIAKRLLSTKLVATRIMNLVRAVSSEGWGRLDYYRRIRRRLDVDPEFRPYFEGESRRLPRFYRDLVKEELGDLWDWLPPGALEHEADAYLRTDAVRRTG